MSQKTKQQKPKQPFVPVLNGHTVPKALYDLVEKQVAKEIHKLKPDRLYLLKEICGEAFWKQQLASAWQRRMVGRAFAYMVATKVFELEFVQYKKYSQKYYRLK